jgi:prepilin-type N-terminal cleavage/methylation domain-containing protein
MKKGFTLLETMIVLLIFGIVLGAIFTAMTMGRLSWYSGDAQVEVQQETRKGLSRMVRELRQTSSSFLQDGQGEDVPADGRYYGKITFKMPAGLDDSGGIVWSDDITYSLGGLNNKQLLRTEGGQSIVLANNITLLQFRRGSTTQELLEINLQAEKKTIREQIIQSTLSSQVKLRN